MSDGEKVIESLPNSRIPQETLGELGEQLGRVEGMMGVMPLSDADPAENPQAPVDRFILFTEGEAIAIGYAYEDSEWVVVSRVEHDGRGPDDTDVTTALIPTLNEFSKLMKLRDDENGDHA